MAESAGSSAPSAPLVPLAARLAGCRLARELRVLAETSSTNDVAAAAGRAGERAGLVVIADRQAAGRGRRGRRWEDAAGEGLALSLLVRPSLPVRRWARLTTWAAVAVAEAAAELTGGETRIKWPNDVYAGDRKLAGILVETEIGANGFAVVGIGVNVNQRQFPAALAARAVSLRQLAAGRPVARDDVAVAVLAALDRWWEALDDRFDLLVRAAEQRGYLLGKTVVIGEGTGAVRGVVVGLDGEGALRIRRAAGGQETVVAGEATVVSVARGALSAG